MSDFEKLIGKTITKVLRDDAHENLSFIDINGDEFEYNTEGDCCSHSWIEHMNGLKAFLGFPILEIIARDMPEATYDHPGHECLQFYGWTFKTSNGYFDIEMRNSSNGYYGGCISYRHGTRNSLDTLTEVTEDF